ncbi:MAG: phage portal protein [Oscillospiraceae bacterium]|nr:phage portal protein [Oscillospiraceae bacterium]
MNYSEIMQAITKVIGADAVYDKRMAAATELWSEMYRGRAPWNTKDVLSAGIASAVAAETARLTTVELVSSFKGSALIEDLYQSRVLPMLRRNTEYGLAGGTLILKPIASGNGMSTQFIRAGRFCPIGYDGSGNITRCAFIDQIRRSRTVYTLLEIHTLTQSGFKVENRAFRSASEELLGGEIALTEVEQWADLAPSAEFSGIDHLPFGIFRVPLANSIDEDSPLGVATYSRAAELIYEADRRYSDLCWEYEAKQAAIHVANSMLDYDRDTGKYKLPEGRERLYRTVNYEKGLNDKPLIDVYSPEIRSSQYLEGFNAQLRLIEFACNLAYGTLSDPNTVDKTAEEIKASKQRSYAYVRDCQEALEHALRGWGEAAVFWARLYGLDSSAAFDMEFEWGDSIIADPEQEREEDRKDLANGTLRPEEYRAKYRGETIEEALANLPDTAAVMP